MNKSIRKMENDLLTHTEHETTHFDVLSDKRQTIKVSFLPFAGKINAKLNLSITKTEKTIETTVDRLLSIKLTQVHHYLNISPCIWRKIRIKILE